MRRRPPLAASSLAAFLVLTGCVTSRPATEVKFDPEVITGDPALEKLNDEELFATGSAKFAANELDEAIRHFDRLASSFPQSKHFRAALFQSGLALQKQQKWEPAYERFRVLADPARGTGDAVDAAFRAAESLYHLDRFAEAVALLTPMVERGDLPVARRIEAQVQQGVCLLELGRRDESEQALRAALASYEKLPDRSDVPDYFPGQAQFFLGELYRLGYGEIQLDGAKGVDQLATDLEHKAQLLLSAQGHYLRAIRIGNGYWATAAGQRIGSMYEDLYDHMLASNPPPELEAEAAEVYREELRKRVRVLITKAIAVYEQTLEAAERVGTSGPFIESTRERLKKMKERLVADAENAETSAVIPPAAVPGSHG